MFASIINWIEQIENTVYILEKVIVVTIYINYRLSTFNLYLICLPREISYRPSFPTFTALKKTAVIDLRIALLVSSSVTLEPISGTLILRELLPNFNGLFKRKVTHKAFCTI